jgi:aspartyl-tRNA(Asn)/glutamyl-tRNA(Gln) amidotransferase subunit A
MTTTTDHSQLVDLTVAEAASAIRRRETSPIELTEAYLARIDRLNPTINAYVHVTADRAREDAKRAEDELGQGVDRGPLHGIPVALKDLVDTVGIPTTGGFEPYRHRVPAADATVAARLREAGAVLLGKTNTHELAFGITTTNPHFGATRNPWDTNRIPGGSSGGSGAAIAARLAVATIGTDTGGSIRIPASFCGCVGLKPTFGLVPKNGVIPLSHVGDHVGPISRTVEDAALVLQVIAGYEPADAMTLPIAIPDYRAELAGGVVGLRVGVPRSSMWGLLDDEVRALAEQAIDVLRSLGAVVVDVELPDHVPVVGMPGSLGFFSVAVEESRFAHREAWSTQPDAFVYAYAAAVRTTLTDVDLLVSATVPIPAPAIGAETVTVQGVELPLIAVGMANTVPYNIARNPAISLPCGFTAAGLPVGLQFAGRPLGEPIVLRAAHAYEQATDWHRQVAPI